MLFVMHIEAEEVMFYVLSAVATALRALKIFQR